MICEKCGDDVDPDEIVDWPISTYKKVCAECADDLDEVKRERGLFPS
jgi:hypothetical protein